MLPNLRLMIAAVLTSVLALSCGFGIFAAFRVSHEPFAHLPAAMAAPQLATENAAQLLAYDLRANDVAGRPVDIPLRGGEEAAASASARSFGRERKPGAPRPSRESGDRQRGL